MVSWRLFFSHHTPFCCNRMGVLLLNYQMRVFFSHEPLRIPQNLIITPMKKKKCEGIQAILLIVQHYATLSKKKKPSRGGKAAKPHIPMKICKSAWAKVHCTSWWILPLYVYIISCHCTALSNQYTLTYIKSTYVGLMYTSIGLCPHTIRYGWNTWLLRFPISLRTIHTTLQSVQFSCVFHFRKTHDFQATQCCTGTTFSIISVHFKVRMEATNTLANFNITKNTVISNASHPLSLLKTVLFTSQGLRWVRFQMVEWDGRHCACSTFECFFLNDSHSPSPNVVRVKNPTSSYVNGYRPW